MSGGKGKGWKRVEREGGGGVVVKILLRFVKIC